MGSGCIFFGFEAPTYPGNLHPVMISAGFVVLGLWSFITAQLPRLRSWRATTVLVGGGVLLAIAAVLLNDLYSIHMWNVNMTAPFGAEVTRDFTLKIWPAPYVAAGLALMLVIIGAIDLRGYLVNRVPHPVAATAGPSRPSFFLRVVLPTVVMLAIWLTAYQFVRSDNQRAHREFQAARATNPNATIPEDSAFKDIAIAVVQGGSVVGPVIVLIFLLRWMWLKMGSTSPKQFWLVTAAVVLVLGLVPAGALFFLFLPRHEVPQASDSYRQLIIGTWTWTGGRVEFRTDGTFEEHFRETVPDVKVGEPIDPEKQKFVEREGTLAGQYDWATRDVIWVKPPGRARAKSPSW